MREYKYRNQLLDLFKLVAAFSVMHLHTRLGIDYEWSAVIRYFCRWAVPFFFISAGYYLAKKTDNQPLTISSVKNNLLNLISIFVVANLIYFAFTVGYGNVWIHNDPKYILLGTFWHLWFLGAMIFGYLAISFIADAFNQSILYLCGVAVIIACIFTSQFAKNINYAELPRFLSGFGCMVSGMILSRINLLRIKKVLALLIALAAPITIYLEFKSAYAGAINLYEIEFSVAIYILACSIFVSCQIFSIKHNAISNLGNQYALFIYLYHVLVYKALEKAISKFGIEIQKVYLFFPLIALPTCIILAVVLNKKTHKFYKFLNGKLT